MMLSTRQLEEFDRDGYLFFPSLFTAEEIGVLLDEVPRLYAQNRPENVREKGSDAVRTRSPLGVITQTWLYSSHLTGIVVTFFREVEPRGEPFMPATTIGSAGASPSHQAISVLMPRAASGLRRAGAWTVPDGCGSGRADARD